MDIYNMGRLSDGDHLLSNIDLSKTIFWVGCGVSINDPTGLPSGQELTEFYIKHALGEDCGTVFLNKWSSLCETISMTTEDDTVHNYEIKMQIPRLEFIINCVDDVDKELQCAKLPVKKMIEGFRHMDMCSPNHNHHLLGQLFLHGATIVTPNFDTCIERSLDVSLETDSSYAFPVYQNQGKSIYHYHETVHNTEGMGATIRKMKSGLNEGMRKDLLKFLNDGYNLICVGFSGSDFFDVTPFFSELSENFSCKFKGKAIFFYHQGTNYGVSKNNIRIAEKMFGAFCDKMILYGDTCAFFERICKSQQIGISEHTQGKTIQKLWRTGFSVPSHLQSKLYLTTILKRTDLLLTEDYLCGEFSAYKDVETFLESVGNDMLQYDIGSYIDCYAQDKNISTIDNLIKLCKRQGFVYGNYHALVQELHYNNKIHSNSKRKSLDDVYSIVNNSNVDELANDSATVYAFNRLANDAFKNHDKDSINKLITCANVLIKIPYHQFMYVSYFLDVFQSYWKLISTGDFNKFEQSVRDKLSNNIEIAAEINGPIIVAQMYSCLEAIYNDEHNIHPDSGYDRIAQKYAGYAKNVNRHLWTSKKSPSIRA